MERSKWEAIITNFQARARGYLVRSELRRARKDFEEIVQEVDGRLTHLTWTGTIVSTPRFTDTNTAPVKPSEPKLDDSSLSSTSPSEAADRVLLEQNEAERDDSQILFRRIRRAEEEQKVNTDEGGMESTRSSSTFWSSEQLHMNGFSQKGASRYCLAQNVPRTPEDLRMHRNTLTMELVWIQQAIDSRKKYLSLKNRLSAS